MSELARREDFIGDIARECGDEIALKFWEGTAGRTVFIPSGATMAAHGEDHWLARLVGFEAAKAICRFLPVSMDVDVPMGEFSNGRMMARRIRELTLSGASVNAIAKAVNCHKRTVSSHRAKLRKEGLL